jgi:hypothetical protein
MGSDKSSISGKRSLNKPKEMKVGFSTKSVMQRNKEDRASHKLPSKLNLKQIKRQVKEYVSNN